MQNTTAYNALESYQSAKYLRVDFGVLVKRHMQMIWETTFIVAKPNWRHNRLLEFGLCYTPTKKYPASKQKFDGFCQIFPKVIVLQKSYIPHWKALIFSFLDV